MGGISPGKGGPYCTIQSEPPEWAKMQRFAKSLVPEDKLLPIINQLFCVAVIAAIAAMILGY